MRRCGSAAVRIGCFPAIACYQEPRGIRFRNSLSTTQCAKIVAPPQPPIARLLAILATAQRQILFVHEFKHYKRLPNILWCFKCPFGFLTHYFKSLQISFPLFFLSFTTSILALRDFVLN